MLLTGSPPRVWGKRLLSLQNLTQARFTPTRVGKTLPGAREFAGETVHPHACGENRLPDVVPGVVVGSPPRVWGKRRCPNRFAGRARFTPTRVGKTRCGYDSRYRPAVHPHACGENGSVAQRPFHLSGSPPRVWGKLSQNAAERIGQRFTPTRVGKTATLPRTAHARRGSPPRVWGKRAPP